MPAKHPLHKTIGESLDTVVLDSFKLVLDPACGGNQNIPLFVEEPKSNSTEYCNVDALFLQKGQVRGIIEIEEANILPTHVCGKFLASALSTFYQHKYDGNQSIPIHNAFFVQVVDSSKLKGDKTSKLDQFKNIEKSIRTVIPFCQNRIASYNLIALAGHNDSDGLSELIQCIENKQRDLIGR